MKKLLLVSTAIAGVALLSSPASAALKMDLGGYFDGYGVYADNHAPTGTDVRNFDFRRDTEVHVNGETTLDNGLTVGAHTEMRVGNNDLQGTNNAGSTTVTTDEVYGYGSGGWGRVNFGQEDGAAYLLQVAAPSADSNIDGLRTYIQALNPAAGTQSANLATVFGNTNAFAGATVGGLDYQQADFRQTDRLTYLTPKVSGFQAGASYAPQNGLTSATGPMPIDGTGLGEGGTAGHNTAAAFKNLWEAAARWDGEFQGVGLSLGGGYSDSSLNDSPVTAATGAGLTAGTLFADDGVKTWNGGASASVAGFTLGGGYRHQASELLAQTIVATHLLANEATGDLTSTTWDAGLGYDNGPYHVGGSYFKENTTQDALAVGANANNVAAAKFEETRYTVGGGYTYGPGMTFRGSVAWGKFDAPDPTESNRYQQVAIGTDIQF